MNSKKIMTWKGCLLLSITVLLLLLAGCAGCPPPVAIPQEALKPLPEVKIPPPAVLNTRVLTEISTGRQGLFFPEQSAFANEREKTDLREAAKLGQANTQAANKIFEILKQPPAKWWQFWKK